MKLKYWLLSIVVAVPVVGGAVLVVLERRLHNPLQEVSAPLSAARPKPAPNPLRNVYFGELHLHTSMSMDANLFDTRDGPRRAYEFAKGGEIELPGSHYRHRLMAPLDFAAVTDHAESMGNMHQCYNRASGTYWSLDCLGIRHQILLVFPRLFAGARQDGKTLASYNQGMCGADGSKCIQGSKSVWQDAQAAAREHYEPGYFTTFIGYEYSPTLIDGGMLHRNVIFRGDKVPFNVFSALDGFAEDLLRWLDRQCTGACQVLTIPHNPNYAWGLMFGDSNSDGSPITRDNLLLRARFDKLVEIFQAKGGSECTTGVGTSDELCNFENMWRACSAQELQIDPLRGQHASRCVGPNDMVRNVLRKGLVDTPKWGFNPYQLGIVAATDNHNGAAGDTQESNFNGHGGVNDALPENRNGTKRSFVAKFLGMQPAVINPGGLTGVWAEENTREAIWDAIHRKETFGTSGTRVRARMFAGFGFPQDLHTRADAVGLAYATGVPMGAELPAAPTGASPKLLVSAMRDANSAPLQRLQIVKGWVTGGETREQVYDVACSDGIQPDPVSHRCRDNGARVNLKDCSIPSDKGASMLATTWTDPDFKPEQAAFYYLRVIENPVCRYSQHDALKLGAPHPGNVPQTIQERAWTSPVWYTPQPGS